MQDATVIRLLGAATLGTLAMFGLIFHFYSWHQKRFVFSKLLFVHGLIVMVTFALVYIKEIFNDLVTNEFEWRNATKLYTYMNIIASIIDYVTAFIMTNATINFFNKSKSVLGVASFCDLSRKTLNSSVLLIALKALLFPLAIEVTLVLRQWRNEPERSLAWTCYTILPLIVSNILPNSFFVVLVVSKMLIGALNARLRDIVSEVNCMQTALQMSLQKSYYRMQRFCDLADKIDLVAEYYTNILSQTMGYTQLVAVPFICSLLCNLFGIIAGFFTQYHAIADTLINDDSYDLFNAVTNAVILIISFSDIALQANICNDNLMEVRDTGIILQRANLADADERFKQSMEAFTLRIFVTKYKIQPLGLLEVDVSLLQDVVSAVTSFLLILIQSDLTLRFSLK